jgi:hypothetical protein
MLNPLRLREMIALASCDSGRGSRAEKICRYSKRDYVAVRLIGTFFRTVAGLLLLAGLIAAAYADSLSAALVRFDFTAAGVAAGVCIAGLVLFSLLLSWRSSVRRYLEAEKEMRRYAAHLRLLGDMTDLPAGQFKGH